MIENLRRIVVAGGKITLDEADKFHAEIIKYYILTLILTLIMWGFNIVGLRAVNYILLVIGSIVIFSKAIKPINIFLAASAGLGINALQDKDKSQGVVAGIIFLSRLFIGIMFGFFLVGGVLATYSFEESPMMFFPIAAMLVLIGLTIEHYKMEGKILPYLIIMYAIVVIANSLWFTFPEKVQNSVKNYVPFTSSTPEKSDMDFPEVKLTEIGKRNGAVIPMNFTTEAKVRILVPLTKVGVAHELCREVVEPIRVLDLVDTPKNQVESDNPNKVGSTHFMHLSREMKGYLFKHGVKEVRVNFYLIEKWAEDPSRCS